jgi:hypothetical protein
MPQFRSQVHRFGSPRRADGMHQAHRNLTLNVALSFQDTTSEMVCVGWEIADINQRIIAKALIDTFWPDNRV